MKTKIQHTILAIFILCLAFSSCKKNEAVADTKKDSIIGKWNMVRYYNKSNPTQNLATYKAGSYMLFSESSIYSYFAENNDPFSSFTAPYVREGNKLRFFNGYLEIIKLTSTQLILDEYEGPNNNGSISYQGTSELSK